MAKYTLSNFIYDIRRGYLHRRKLKFEGNIYLSLSSNHEGKYMEYTFKNLKVFKCIACISVNMMSYILVDESSFQILSLRFLMS